MKAVIQRVTQAKVTAGTTLLGQIGPGLVILLGIETNDTAGGLDRLAAKILNLRLFSNRQDKFNYSALEKKADLLVVSQFTLLGDSHRGRRPSFLRAAPPQTAEPLFNRFVQTLQSSGLKIATGRFGAKMKVSLVNDGPVTLILDRQSLKISSGESTK